MPHSAAIIIAGPICPLDEDSRNSVALILKHRPTARPSRPSIILTAFIAVTMNSTLSGNDNHAR